ncbi:MAG: hypothetical protein ACRCY6_01885 [Bacteroidales bacterium]
MKTSSNIFTLSWALSLAFLTLSCGNQSSTQGSLTTINTSANNYINYPIPTAYEITNLINRSGAAYVIGITNSTEKAENYITEKEKAFALGIYGADLAYATTYNMQKETMDYMKVIKYLVEDLQISNNFNVSLAQRIEKNIEEKDSLVAIVTQSFQDTYSFLMHNGKDNIAIMVLTGTWIEGLYLTTQVGTTSLRKTDLYQIIANQKESLAILINILEKNSDDADIANLRQTLDPLVIVYNKVQQTIEEKQAFIIADLVESIRNELVK